MFDIETTLRIFIVSQVVFNVATIIAIHKVKQPKIGPRGFTGPKGDMGPQGLPGKCKCESKTE